MTTAEKIASSAEADSQRILVWLDEQGEPVTWCMRLRLHTITKIISDELGMTASFRGREVRIFSRVTDQPLREADWLIFKACGFENAFNAAAFGLALQKSLSLTAALRSTPIDIGIENIWSFSLASKVRDDVEAAGAAAGQKIFIIPDAHGVSVHPNAPTSAMFASGTASLGFLKTEEFLAEVEGLGGIVDAIDEPARLSALLLNAASMASHPVASLALHIAAVELLSATERWSNDQRAWIKMIRDTMPGTDEILPDERAELYKAADGMLNFGALDKTRRLIRRIGREDLLGEWKTLYEDRSKLFHGARFLTNTKILSMSASATTLCGEIVKAYIRQQIESASHAESPARHSADTARNCRPGKASKPC